MKNFLIFIVLIVAAYFAYDNFLKEKTPYEINDSYSKQREAVDIDAPAIQPRDFASYQGTIKNIGDKVLTNVAINYLIDAQPASASINKLEPGEEKSFKTNEVMLRHMDAAHHLKEVTFMEK
jgi:hypothetical protein